MQRSMRNAKKVAIAAAKGKGKGEGAAKKSKGKGTGKSSKTVIKNHLKVKAEPKKATKPAKVKAPAAESAVPWPPRRWPR